MARSVKRARIHRHSDHHGELEEERDRPAVEPEREEDDAEKHRALEYANQRENDVFGKYVIDNR